MSVRHERSPAERATRSILFVSPHAQHSLPVQQVSRSGELRARSSSAPCSLTGAQARRRYFRLRF